MTSHDLRYCPRCAGSLEVRNVGHPSSPHPACVACGFILWQNLKPSVEAVIVRGDGAKTEVLLGQRRVSGKVAWDLPGGFLNTDDRLHAALRRECLREMGVEVEVGDLLGAFEDDFHGSLIVSLVYVCTIKRGNPRAADIIEEVRWFAMTALPEPASPAVGEALGALQRKVGA